MQPHLVETRQHGSAECPFAHYAIDETHPRYVMQAHWHREFEIIYVLQGTLHVVLDAIPYTLHSGEVLFVHGGCLHQAKPEDCVYRCLVFDPKMLLRAQNDGVKAYLTPFCELQGCVHNAFPPPEELYQTTMALFALSPEACPSYALTLYGLLFTFFAQLYACGYVVHHPRENTHRSLQTVKQITDYIESHHAEPLTLEELSRMVQRNPKTVCRLFKQYTGKTLVEYINGIRLDNACYDMTAGGKSITDAAFDNGFGNLSYFCRLFRRLKGVTPTEYRRLAKTSE